MSLEKDVKTTAEVAGLCYGCPDWPGRGYATCDEGHNIKKMQKKGVPCYSMFGTLSYSVKDEFDNVETKHPD